MMKQPSPARLGRFIVFEGGDGAGKSTQMAELQKWLDKNLIEHIVTREPGGCSLAEDLRGYILSAEHPPIVELMLLMTARAAHITETILPALQANKWVLCDRFVDSTLAYQGYGGQADITVIQKLQSIVDHDVQPDLTILLDIPYKSVAERKTAPDDGIEARDSDYQERVYQGFRTLAQESSRPYLVLNGQDTIPNIHTKIIQKISQMASEYDAA